MRRHADKILAGVLIVAFLALNVGIALVHSKLVYGNYSCAFAHCVKVK